MHRRHFRSGKLSLSFFLFSFLMVATLCLLLYASHRFFSPADTSIALPVENTITVILDPGHGGEDGGAVGKNGIYEKNLNLSIAKKVESNLTAWGFSVFCTRNEDILLYDRNEDFKGRKKVLDLAARLKIAKDTENCIFVSIHMNSFPETKYNGLQVYYSPNDPRSAELADLIQNEVRKQLQPTNARKTKQASTNIYLLNRITSPAILIECGFLSNVEECAKLSSEQYREELSYAISCAIADYLETHS